jgi:hypothetical protein
MDTHSPETANGIERIKLELSFEIPRSAIQVFICAYLSMINCILEYNLAVAFGL